MREGRREGGREGRMDGRTDGGGREGGREGGRREGGREGGRERREREGEERERERERERYLKDPWFELAIQKNIETKDLKAGRPSVVVGETRSVVMLQDWMSRHQRFDYHIL